ncbi:MAG: hypothetical protein EOP90_00655 [Lysobacteraceae bacterium]|nr:MAG: hypothetical protein EOP90_00655 [Xanthomonadaceae bacterium]
MTTIVAKVSQLIHCEAVDAFEAFADPDKITRFWLRAASGPLSTGSKVEWSFMVPGVMDSVTVLTCTRPSSIELTWSDGSMTRFEFSAHAQGKTKVSIEAEVTATTDFIEQVVSTTEGFAIVLCDLKTYLESGQSANLVRAKAELIGASMIDPKLGV